MNDELTRLRHGLAEIAEQGGNADLYDRVLRTSYRITMRRRLALCTAGLAVAALAVGVPLALRPDGSRQPAPAASTSASPAPTTTPTTTPSPSTAPPTTAAVGCPASPETLLEALQASEFFARAGAPTTMLVLACHQEYAAARGIGGSPTSDQYVLFRFDTPRQRWRAVNVGNSSSYCAGRTPADVAARLPGCASTSSGAAAASSRSSTPGGAPTQTAPPSHGCPTTAATLLATLKRDAKAYDAVGRPAALYNVDCSGNMAVAYTTPGSTTNATWVAFGNSTQDGGVGDWYPLASGNGESCVLLYSTGPGSPPPISCSS